MSKRKQVVGTALVIAVLAVGLVAYVSRRSGDGTAPSPFDYFLVSLAACAGYYALAFCRERKIPVEGLGVTMTTERGEVSKMIDKISIAVVPPAGFPEKYRAALVKSVDHCTVKAHMMRPPQFEVSLAP